MKTPTLPPYAPDATCPKCGCEEVATLFCDNPRPLQACWRLRLDKDHFHRHCTRCGYEWLEACMAAEKAEAE